MKILPLLLLGSAFVFGQSGSGKVAGTRGILAECCDPSTASPITCPAPKPAGKKKAAKKRVVSGGGTAEAASELSSPPVGVDLPTASQPAHQFATRTPTARKYSTEPIDVPAIQETRTFDMTIGSDSEFCKNVVGGKLVKEVCQRTELVWTCPDKHSYTLQTSVDGEVRICHRIKP